MAEIDEAVRTARQAGCPDIVLLKCTSTYPATPVDTNLLTLPNLRDWSGCQIGLSDHTMGIGAAVAAVALGATLIEKHFNGDSGVGTSQHRRRRVLPANDLRETNGNTRSGCDCTGLCDCARLKVEADMAGPWKVPLSERMKRTT